MLKVIHQAEPDDGRGRYLYRTKGIVGGHPRDPLCEHVRVYRKGGHGAPRAKDQETGQPPLVVHPSATGPEALDQVAREGRPDVDTGSYETLRFGHAPADVRVPHVLFLRVLHPTCGRHVMRGRGTAADGDM